MKRGQQVKMRKVQTEAAAAVKPTKATKLSDTSVSDKLRASDSLPSLSSNYSNSDSDFINSDPELEKKEN